jgi:beta-1,4-mannosyl-glycoprotein beta-1,4-N-acetylglucosaminyltransferase
MHRVLMLPLPILCTFSISSLLIFTLVFIYGLSTQDVLDVTVGFTRPIWGTSDKPTFQYHVTNDGFETPGISCVEMGWRSRFGKPGKLYDTFIFSTELDLLEIRLRELSGIVDSWILVESDRTHTNLPKKLWWHEQGRHEKRFERYLDRIESIVVRGKDIDRSKTFLRMGAYGLEAMQRRAIMKGLHNRGIQDGDVFITGDVDEIPNRATGLYLTKCDLFPQDITLHMPTFIGGFQFHSYEEDKRHAKARMYRKNRKNPQWVSHHQKIGNFLMLHSGWHCSWCFKTLDQFRFKMDAGVHHDRSSSNLNSPNYISDATINDRLSRGEPPLERTYERPESYTFHDAIHRWYEKWNVNGRQFSKHDMNLLPIALNESPKKFHYLIPGGTIQRERGTDGNLIDSRN